MKKTSLSIVAIVSLIAFSACSAKEPISEKKAMDIAVKDAGLSTSDVTFTKQSYDKEDNEYDFDFHTNTEKYEYEIDGENGKIKNKEKKQTNTTNDTQTGATESTSNEKYTEEQTTFLKLALAHFKLEQKDIERVSVKKEQENGTPVYDVKFYKGKVEYSCEIQIDNQAILSSEIDQH